MSVHYTHEYDMIPNKQVTNYKLAKWGHRGRH